MQELDGRARELDAKDPLAGLRAGFALPGEGLYLVGNSLGPPLLDAARRAAAFVEDQWARHLVAGWHRCGWMERPFELGDRIGRLVGAAPGQVVVGDTTTLQLFRALAAARRLRPERRVVVAEADNFPADNYIAQGLAQWLRPGFELRLVPGEALLDAIDEEVAVVTASHVNYRSCAVRDLPAINEAAHTHGALVVWDLAHTAGVIDPQLDAHDTDFAVGCTYKYLNAGPGAPAYLYVARRLQAEARSPTLGWLGHADPFAMAPSHEAAPGIRGFLCGTPRMVAMDALDHALSTFDGVDLEVLTDKTRALGQLFIEALAPAFAAHPLELASPAEPAARGGHVALRHPHAHELVRALEAQHISTDFRAPDVMRVAFAPAYCRYMDALTAARAIREALDTRAWDRPEFHRRRSVT